MVRLKVDNYFESDEPAKKSQSHYGSIKSIPHWIDNLNKITVSIPLWFD